VRKPIVTTLILAGSLTLLAGTAAGTFLSVCNFDPGKAYLDAGPSYCHNAALVVYHTIADCPCRVSGSVSATGPFACNFFQSIEWGGPLGGNSITSHAPTAMVTTYDITLDCGETYTVDLSCSCGERPRWTYYLDQGACTQPCEEDPPSQGG
jgi:hypothetical protein